MDLGERESLDEVERRKAEQQNMAQELFALTRAQYTAQELQTGIYAETHFVGDETALCLKPKTSLFLITKPYDGSHSVFDEVLTNDVRAELITSEIPEVVALARQLGLRAITARARGVYRENEDTRSFTLQSSMTKINAGVANLLRTRFGIQKILQGNTFSSTEHEIDFECLPEVKATVEFNETTEVDGPIETGIASYISCHTDLGMRFGIEGAMFGQVADVYLTFWTSCDRTHSQLVESLESKWNTYDQETYTEDYLQSEGYRDSVKSRSKSLRNGIYHLMPDENAELISLDLHARYMVDHTNKRIKLEVLLNPDRYNDFEDQLTLFEREAVLILTATSVGMSERGYNDYTTDASIIINEARYGSNTVYAKTVALPPVNNNVDPTQILPCFTQIDWMKIGND